MGELRKPGVAVEGGVKMSIDSLKAEIAALAQKWCILISRDHHKDRDCHFSVECRWSYGHAQYYTVRHYGYIVEFSDVYPLPSLAMGRDYFSGFRTEEEALAFLKDAITDMIHKEEERQKGELIKETN
jgi:hypothetical protein